MHANDIYRHVRRVNVNAERFHYIPGFTTSDLLVFEKPCDCSRNIADVVEVVEVGTIYFAPPASQLYSRIMERYCLTNIKTLKALRM